MVAGGSSKCNNRQNKQRSPTPDSTEDWYRKWWNQWGRIRSLAESEDPCSLSDQSPVSVLPQKSVSPPAPVAERTMPPKIILPKRLPAVEPEAVVEPVPVRQKVRIPPGKYYPVKDGSRCFCMDEMRPHSYPHLMQLGTVIGAKIVDGVSYVKLEMVSVNRNKPIYKLPRDEVFEFVPSATSIEDGKSFLRVSSDELIYIYVYFIK